MKAGSGTVGRSFTGWINFLFDEFAARSKSIGLAVIWAEQA